MQESTFEIVEHIGVIDTIDNREEKWTKEVNVVAWNGGKPKIDVRDWNERHDRMSRGITLAYTLKGDELDNGRSLENLGLAGIDRNELLERCRG